MTQPKINRQQEWDPRSRPAVQAAGAQVYLLDDGERDIEQNDETFILKVNDRLVWKLDPSSR